MWCVVLRFLMDGCEGVFALEKQDMRADVAGGERGDRGPFALSLCLVILTSANMRRCSVYFIERAMRICHLGDFTRECCALMSARVYLLASACLRGPVRNRKQQSRHFMQEMSPVDAVEYSSLLRSSSCFCSYTSKPPMRAC